MVTPFKFTCANGKTTLMNLTLILFLSVSLSTAVPDSFSGLMTASRNAMLGHRASVSASVMNIPKTAPVPVAIQTTALGATFLLFNTPLTYDKADESCRTAGATLALPILLQLLLPKDESANASPLSILFRHRLSDVWLMRMPSPNLSTLTCPLVDASAKVEFGDCELLRGFICFTAGSFSGPVMGAHKEEEEEGKLSLDPGSKEVVHLGFMDPQSWEEDPKFWQEIN